MLIHLVPVLCSGTSEAPPKGMPSVKGVPLGECGAMGPF